MDSSNGNDEQLMEEKDRTKRSPRELGIGLINFVLALCLAIALSTGIRMAMWKIGVMSSIIDELAIALPSDLTEEQLGQYDEALKTEAKLAVEEADESGMVHHFYLSVAVSCLIMILCRKRIIWDDLPLAAFALTVVVAMVDHYGLQRDAADLMQTHSIVFMSFLDDTLRGWYSALPADGSLDYLATGVALPARARVAYSLACNMAEMRAWWLKMLVPSIGSVLTSLPWLWRKLRDHHTKFRSTTNPDL